MAKHLNNQLPDISQNTDHMLTEVVVAWELEEKIQDVYVCWLILCVVAISKEVLLGDT